MIISWLKYQFGRIFLTRHHFLQLKSRMPLSSSCITRQEEDVARVASDPLPRKKCTEISQLSLRNHGYSAENIASLRPQTITKISPCTAVLACLFFWWKVSNL